MYRGNVFLGDKLLDSLKKTLTFSMFVAATNHGKTFRKTRHDWPIIRTVDPDPHSECRSESRRSGREDFFTFEQFCFLLIEFSNIS